MFRVPLLYKTMLKTLFIPSITRILLKNDQANHNARLGTHGVQLMPAWAVGTPKRVSTWLPQRFALLRPSAAWSSLYTLAQLALACPYGQAPLKFYDAGPYMNDLTGSLQSL